MNRMEGRESSCCKSYHHSCQQYFRNNDFKLALCLNSHNISMHKNIYDSMKSFPSGHAQLSCFAAVVAMVGPLCPLCLFYPSRLTSTREWAPPTVLSGDTGFSLSASSLQHLSPPAACRIIAIMCMMWLPGLLWARFLPSLLQRMSSLATREW